MRYELVCITDLNRPVVVEERLNTGWKLVGGPIVFNGYLYQAMTFNKNWADQITL